MSCLVNRDTDILTTSMSCQYRQRLSTNIGKLLWLGIINPLHCTFPTIVDYSTMYYFSYDVWGVDAQKTQKKVIHKYALYLSHNSLHFMWFYYLSINIRIWTEMILFITLQIDNNVGIIPGNDRFSFNKLAGNYE